MLTPDDLSSAFDSGTLQAAYVKARRREKREKFQKEIQEMLERYDEFEEREADTPEVQYERNEGGSSKRKANRPRTDSPSGDESDEVPIRRPIAKVRRVDPKPVSPQSPSCTRCLKKGVRCEWDRNSIRRRCIACQSGKAGCDLKRPIPAGSSANGAAF